MTTGKRMNFSSQRRDRSDRAYLFTRPKAKVCKVCTTILRSTNETEFCSIHQPIRSWNNRELGINDRPR